MTDTMRAAVRTVVATWQRGEVTYQEGLAQLTALGLAPQVAGILLRQAAYQQPMAA